MKINFESMIALEYEYHKERGGFIFASFKLMQEFSNEISDFFNFSPHCEWEEEREKGVYCFSRTQYVGRKKATVHSYNFLYIATGIPQNMSVYRIVDVYNNGVEAEILESPHNFERFRREAIDLYEKTHTIEERVHNIEEFLRKAATEIPLSMIVDLIGTNTHF